MTALRPAVFLDRDGVINAAVVRAGKPYPPARVEDVVILPGVAGALAELRRAGFALVVVTNQPDVARGTQTRAAVDAIHARLRAELPLDAIYSCFHDDHEACACRKPAPGMLRDAARDLGLDLARSVLVGDRWRDVEAGIAAGCRTVFVDYGYAERQPAVVDAKVGSLAEGAAWILQEVKAMTAGIPKLNVKLFADGADKKGMLDMYGKPWISGFTTNPTLMRKAGVSDYRAFAREVLDAIADRPISFEVFSDEFADMERQARDIASWGKNVYVKIPVTNTKRATAYELIKKLASAGIKLNVTAVFTLEQVRDVVAHLQPNVPSYVSVFAGRIADTGRDPIPHMAAAKELVRLSPAAELIWASPRELLNVFHAEQAGSDIITMTNDLLAKLPSAGKDLAQFSLETVQMFHDDATKAGFQL
jgi:transaldolase